MPQAGHSGPPARAGAGGGPGLSLRLHRALSWLNRAEQLADDPDSQFIFLWIAFNAAYALGYAQEWDRAQAVLNRAAGWDLSKKEREDLKEAGAFVADWKARMAR